MDQQKDSQNDIPKARSKERFSNVYITLGLKVNQNWDSIKARDWNNNGFNFSTIEKIESETITLRKHLHQFSGKVIWSHENDDDGILREIVLNDMLFRQLHGITDNLNTISRVFTMIRTYGIIQEKKQLLNLFSIEADDEEIETKVQEYKFENKMYRYGIKMSSDEWEKVVKHTLKSYDQITEKNIISRQLSRLKNEKNK